MSAQIPLEKPVPKLQLVVFDMDGLLIDTEPLAIMAWMQAGKEYGYDITRPVMERMIGLDARSSLEIMYALYGTDFPYDMFVLRKREIINAHVLQHGIQVKPGVLTLLDFLDAQHLPRVVATSTGKARAQHHLETAGIWSRMDALFSGEEVTNGKPAPDLFLHAANSVGICPQACVVFEDSTNGVLGAFRAGMLAVQVPDLLAPNEITQQSASYILSSLEQAPDLLRNWL